MGVYLGLLIGVIIGGICLTCILVANSSIKHHNKRHTHHSELMCGHCTNRAYHSGYSMEEQMRRWPRRIFGAPAPRGEG